SLPRAARAPPMTLTWGSTAFSASYVCASRDRYAAAAASEPSAANCGIQKRFRFGSLPTITSFTCRSARGIDAANDANCVRASSVSGVTPLNEYTATIGRIPAAAADVTAPRSRSSSASSGDVAGGVHTSLRTIARKPARRASAIAAAGSPAFAASSTAPTTSGCALWPPPHPAASSTAAAAAVATMPLWVRSPIGAPRIRWVEWAQSTSRTSSSSFRRSRACTSSGRRSATSSTSARRSRVGRGDTRVGIDKLVHRIADVETIVTGSEVEALHLEQHDVKRHRPPFNVRLRDDKSFPYIAVTVEDEYPRVMFTRERHR